jgi:hypothetical protein
MVNERLYRYLTLDQAVKLAYALTMNQKGSKILLGLLEKVFIKHRKALSMKKGFPQMIEVAYRLNGLGSDILFQSLKNPNIELIGMESKRPKMDKIDQLYGATHVESEHKEIPKISH